MVDSPLAIIAGNGQFPLEVAKRAKEMGIQVFAICHLGETDKSIETLVDGCCWVKIGQLGKILDGIKRFKVKQALFTGGISRVRLFSNAFPDMKTLLLIARVGSTRDDAFLRGVAEEVEKLQVKVISSGDILRESVVKQGKLTKRALSSQEINDALVGWDAAKALGVIDAGQTAVCAKGLVVALECVEGTDATIIRAGELTQKKGCVVVKTAKPQQDLRLDLPSIGTGTIESMVDAGATALILEEGKAMVLDPEIFSKKANDAGIAVFVAATRESLTSLGK